MKLQPIVIAGLLVAVSFSAFADSTAPLKRAKRPMQSAPIEEVIAYAEESDNESNADVLACYSPEMNPFA